MSETFAFGTGALVVDTGFYDDRAAVFIRPSATIGPIGEPAEAVPVDCLQPGEQVLTFPTSEQAKRVADALVTPSDTPASAAKGEGRLAVNMQQIEAWIDGGERRDDVPSGAIKELFQTVRRAIAQPHSSHQAGTEDYAGLVNAAVDDLTIAPHWHTGLSRAETELVQAAFQNGVEVATDAILAALTSEVK